MQCITVHSLEELALRRRRRRRCSGSIGKGFTLEMTRCSLWQAAKKKTRLHKTTESVYDCLQLPGARLDTSSLSASVPLCRLRLVQPLHSLYLTVLNSRLHQDQAVALCALQTNWLVLQLQHFKIPLALSEIRFTTGEL